MQPIEERGWLIGRNKRTARRTRVPRPLIEPDPGSWTRLNSSRRPLTHPPGISRGRSRLLTARLTSSPERFRGERTHARTHATHRTVLVLALGLGLGRASAPARQIVNITHFGDWRRQVWRRAATEFRAASLRPQSVLWLRRTRHFDLKPLHRRRRQKTLFGKWLRHFRACAWMGDRRQPGKACSVGLSKSQAMHACFVLSISAHHIQSENTLAWHCGVSQALAGVRLLCQRRGRDTRTPSPFPPFFCQIPDVHPQSRPRSILPARQSCQGPGHTASHPQHEPAPGLSSIPFPPMGANPLLLALIGVPFFLRGSRTCIASDPMR